MGRVFCTFFVLFSFSMRINILSPNLWGGSLLMSEFFKKLLYVKVSLIQLEFYDIQGIYCFQVP